MKLEQGHYHEAAHALVAYALGQHVVELGCYRRSSGLVDAWCVTGAQEPRDPPTWRRPKATADHTIARSVAGIIGEALYSRRSMRTDDLVWLYFNELDDRPETQDMHIAIKVACALEGGKHVKGLGRVERVGKLVRSYLVRYYTALDALARLLQKHGILDDPAEIERCLASNGARFADPTFMRAVRRLEPLPAENTAAPEQEQA